MIQYHIFPGGRRRVVTFSYDDGPKEDERLVALFNRYGVKGTFHLNGQNYIGATEEEKEAVRRLYKGHEISCHTVHHPWPSRMPPASLVTEVLEDRRILEEIAGYPVRGMSYPSGSYSDEVKSVLAACGIVYSRTTRDTMEPRLPEDFLAWHPTCHQPKATDELLMRFMTRLDSEWVHPLLYIWGHSHEFHTEADWENIERIVRTVAGNEKIWYATNIEIYDYMQAQRMLRINVAETVFENPTSTDVWVEKDKSAILHIPAGETLRI